MLYGIDDVPLGERRDDQDDQPAVVQVYLPGQRRPAVHVQRVLLGPLRVSGGPYCAPLNVVVCTLRPIAWRDENALRQNRLYELCYHFLVVQRTSVRDIAPPG